MTTGLWGPEGDGARRPGSLCTGVPSLHHPWLTAGMVLQPPPRHNPQTTTTSLRKSLCSTAERPGSSGPLFPQLTLGWAEASGAAEGQRLSPLTTYHPQPCDFGGPQVSILCSHSPGLGTALLSRVLFERLSSVQANCFFLSTSREGGLGEWGGGWWGDEPQKSARLKQ